jgi:hypothetical protein
MCGENNVENKITMLEKQIIELQEKYTKLETLILNNNSKYYNTDYNIKNEVNLDNISSFRSIYFTEPKLVRQHAFMLSNN